VYGCRDIAVVDVAVDYVGRCPAAGRAALMVDVNHPSLGWM